MDGTSLPFVPWNEHLHEYSESDDYEHFSNPQDKDRHMSCPHHNFAQGVGPLPQPPMIATNLPEKYFLDSQAQVSLFKEFVFSLDCNELLASGDCDIRVKAHDLAVHSIEQPFIPPQKRRNFCFSARHFVREWLDAHDDDPYPTTDEKESFAKLLNLSLRQISNLFNNERRRYKRNHELPREHSRNHLDLSSISDGRSPMDRYLSSSPEEDPQPVQLVANAAATFRESPPHEDGTTQPSKKRRISTPRTGGVMDNSSYSDKSSIHGSSGISGSSCASGKKGKRRTKIVRQSTSANGRYFCTYCWKNFISSMSCRRHETMHNPQKLFECRMAGLNPTLSNCGGCLGSEVCRKSLNHNYKACLDLEKERRIFSRKDHFSNHLLRIHNATFTPVMDSWVCETSKNTSYRCGYCLMRLPTWTERLDHIGDHYRYHDDFDKYKWQLLPDTVDDEAAEAGLQMVDIKSPEDAAFVLMNVQQDVKVEISNFLSTYLSKANPYLPISTRDGYLPRNDALVTLGTSVLFLDWTDQMLLAQRNISLRRSPLRYAPHADHSIDCLAGRGGRCKFDKLNDLWTNPDPS